MASFHRLKKEVGLFVLNKFNYKCSLCNSSENLCVHHIIKMEPNNPNYNDIDNLTVLCRRCHMSLHRRQNDINHFNHKTGMISNPCGRRGKNTEPVYCMIDGCNNLQHGRNLCKKHYERYRRNNLLFK